MPWVCPPRLPLQNKKTEGRSKMRVFKGIKPSNPEPASVHSWLSFFSVPKLSPLERSPDFIPVDDVLGPLSWVPWSGACAPGPPARHCPYVLSVHCPAVLTPGYESESPLKVSLAWESDSSINTCLIGSSKEKPNTAMFNVIHRNKAYNISLKVSNLGGGFTVSVPFFIDDLRCILTFT